MISRDLRHAQNVGARHRWLNRLQTALLVLTLLGIAAVAGSLLLGDGGLWLALAAAGFTLLLEPAAASGLTLRLYGARPLHPDEAPDLWAVLRELAARAGARRLWLMHYSPIITDPEAARPAAEAAFPAVECGVDGQQIILRYDEEPL